MAPGGVAEDGVDADAKTGASAECVLTADRSCPIRQWIEMPAPICYTYQTARSRGKSKPSLRVPPGSAAGRALRGYTAVPIGAASINANILANRTRISTETTRGQLG